MYRTYFSAENSYLIQISEFQEIFWKHELISDQMNTMLGDNGHNKGNATEKRDY
jgi:hypothetical protein